MQYKIVEHVLIYHCILEIKSEEISINILENEVGTSISRPFLSVFSFHAIIYYFLLLKLIDVIEKDGIIWNFEKRNNLT